MCGGNKRYGISAPQLLPLIFNSLVQSLLRSSGRDPVSVRSRMVTICPLGRTKSKIKSLGSGVCSYWYPEDAGKVGMGGSPEG